MRMGEKCPRRRQNKVLSNACFLSPVGKNVLIVTPGRLPICDFPEGRVLLWCSGKFASHSW